jgi:hypothetical protein
MTTVATNHRAVLRRALLLDTITSGTMGVLLLAAGGLLAAPLGLPASLLRWTGVVLIPFAAYLAWVATRADISPDAVRSIIRVNVVWALGTPLLLVSGWVRPTLLGELFVVLQAVAVAGLAFLEYRTLRHGGERTRPAPSGAGR